MPPILCANAPPVSAAKLFLQLCARRTTVISNNSSSILDLLLPPTRALHIRSARAAAPRGRSRNPITQHVGPPPPRLFSTSAPWRKTEILFNPQRDDEGNEMHMEITPRAANRLSQIMAKDSNPYLALRIQVESGGCHGFQYLMSLTTLPRSLPAAPADPPSPPNNTTAPDPPSSDATAPEVTPSTTTSAAPSSPGLGEDDTVFAFLPDNDNSNSTADNSGAGGQQQQRRHHIDDNNNDGHRSLLTTAPKIVLDAPSLGLLAGSKVDFTMELIGSQFKIVDNPAATSSCGCGTSFDIKI
ncbi:hypothetical protein F4779DRAFT_562336 [Xylariaceae sp. FL0662B]|nr:hypothetical protein F4779DRAFT_562336 [Xylariaceae sp. FL0662B]